MSADIRLLNRDDAEIVAADRQRPPAFTDEALALRFAALHAVDLRYVAAASKWFIYNGKQWRADDTLHAFDMARLVCREASVECNKKKVANLLASAKTIAAVERLAKSDRKLAATMDQWDRDPMVLNTPGGVIDLVTGEMREHRASDYLTRMANSRNTACTPRSPC